MFGIIKYISNREYKLNLSSGKNLYHCTFAHINLYKRIFSAVMLRGSEATTSHVHLESQVLSGHLSSNLLNSLFPILSAPFALGKIFV